MLAIPQVDLKLLLCSRIKAKVGLVGEVISVKLHFDEAGF
jgi:hypothetical protein